MQFSDRKRLFYLHVQEAWRRLRTRVVVARLSVTKAGRAVPDRLVVAPTDLRAIDAFVAEEILEGRFPFAGRILHTEGHSPFTLEQPSRIFAERLHSFAWLRHIRAEKTDTACANARLIVADWIGLHGKKISGIAWEPDVISQRLIAWLSHSPVILQQAESGFYRRFMKSLVFQARYLAAIVGLLRDGEVRLRVRIALAMVSVCLPSKASAVKKAGRHLDRELDRQILPDGGHISRDPRATLNLLLDLLPLRQTYINLGHEVPQKLIPAIDRMYPAIRFFRHHNGDLALFNGATATLATELMSVLRYDESSGQPFKALPHAQYHRLSAGQTTIIVDTGSPLSTDLSLNAHAGCLSFEMSHGKHRFVVNAGSPKFAGRRYRQMARATAAHSTVTLSDTSSSKFSASTHLGALMTDMAQLETERWEDQHGNDWLRAVHDGYRDSFGYLHEREIGINGKGEKIKGRDRLFLAQENGKHHGPSLQAVARFHIHPAIMLTQRDSESVLMQAPDGESWLFTAPGLKVSITEDIFFADASGICRSQQLEISFSVPENPEIRWMLKRDLSGGTGL